MRLFIFILGWISGACLGFSAAVFYMRYRIRKVLG